MKPRISLCTCLPHINESCIHQDPLWSYHVACTARARQLVHRIAICKCSPFVTSPSARRTEFRGTEDMVHKRTFNSWNHPDILAVDLRTVLATCYNESIRTKAWPRLYHSPGQAPRMPGFKPRVPGESDALRNEPLYLKLGADLIFR